MLHFKPCTLNLSLAQMNLTVVVNIIMIVITIQECVEIDCYQRINASLNPRNDDNGECGWHAIFANPVINEGKYQWRIRVHSKD